MSVLILHITREGKTRKTYRNKWPDGEGDEKSGVDPRPDYKLQRGCLVPARPI